MTAFDIIVSYLIMNTHHHFVILIVAMNYSTSLLLRIIIFVNDVVISMYEATEKATQVLIFVD